MTPDQLERMARLEVEMNYLKEAAERADTRSERIEAKLDGLVAKANMGQGALWVFMAVGGILVAVATWIIEHVRINPT